MDLDIVTSNNDLFGESQHLSSQESACPAPRLKPVIVVPNMPAVLASSGSSSCHGEGAGISLWLSCPLQAWFLHTRHDRHDPRVPMAPSALALPHPSCSKSRLPFISNWTVAKLQVLKEQCIPFACTAPKSALFSLYVCSLGSRQCLPSAALAQPDHVAFPISPARDDIIVSPDNSLGEVQLSAGRLGLAPRQLASVDGPTNTVVTPIACLASSVFSRLSPPIFSQAFSAPPLAMPLPSSSQLPPLSSQALPLSSHPLSSSFHPLPSSFLPIPSSSLPVPSSSQPFPLSSLPIPSPSQPLPFLSYPFPQSFLVFPVCPSASISHPVPGLQLQSLLAQPQPFLTDSSFSLYTAPRAVAPSDAHLFNPSLVSSALYMWILQGADISRYFTPLLPPVLPPPLMRVTFLLPSSGL